MITSLVNQAGHPWLYIRISEGRKWGWVRRLLYGSLLDQLLPQFRSILKCRDLGSVRFDSLTLRIGTWGTASCQEDCWHTFTTFRNCGWWTQTEGRWSTAPTTGPGARTCSPWLYIRISESRWGPGRRGERETLQSLLAWTSCQRLMLSFKIQLLPLSPNKWF